MIKVGTLCWVTKLTGAFAVMNGDVVTVESPLQWVVLPRRFARMAHKISTPAHAPSYHPQWWAQPEYLLPFSDPQNTDKEKTSTPNDVVTA